MWERSGQVITARAVEERRRCDDGDRRRSSGDWIGLDWKSAAASPVYRTWCTVYCTGPSNALAYTNHLTIFGRC